MPDDTLPQMFWRRVEMSGGLPAQMVTHDGRWRTLTWSEVGDIVRDLAHGLLALDRQRGETVALLSSNRAEWVQADFAVLSAGCVTVPIYATFTPELIAYIVNDAEATTLIVENPIQLQKVWEAKRKAPCLERIVVIEGYAEQPPSVLTWEELRRLGRSHAARSENAMTERLASIRSEDIATIVYTSGTTGLPKGVVQTHANHLAALQATAQITPVLPGDVHLLVLPLAHAFARLEEFMAVHVGLTTAFVGRVDKLADALREVRPHFCCGVPRLYEKIQAGLLTGAEGGSPIKKQMFRWALGIGREVSRRQQAKQPIPFALRLKHRLAHALVFARLREAMGGRLRFAVSGGAPLSRELAEFFHAVGILILEGYGLTESCPVLTFNRIGHFKFGSVGPALPGVELKIAADGEILARGPTIATRGYLKQPELTAEAFPPDGWLHTGDIGSLDDEGFLYITDRKKDLIVTSSGFNVAPQSIETLLKGDPLVSQVIVCGDRRPYLVALITLNPVELAKFAERQGITAIVYQELIKHPDVVERMGLIVEMKNVALPSYSKIKRFAILPVEFTEVGGELSATQKVRRKVIADRYGDVIESLYG